MIGFSANDSDSEPVKTQLGQTDYEQRARIGRLINLAQSALVVQLDKALRRFDVSAAQYVILATLWAGRGDTAAQICKEISYSPGAMTRMLFRLESKGLIYRAVDENNRRSYKLELTEEGRTKFPELRAASSALIDRFFGAFSTAELREFERLLEQMLSRA